MAAEFARAIFAMADDVAREAAPTVVRETFGAITPGDFAQQIGNVFAIIGPIDTGDEQVPPAIRFSICIDAEPIRVRVIKFIGRAAGIHPGEYRNPVIARSMQDFAKEIAIAQKLSAPMQRILTGIIRDDAAGVDDNALDASSFPIIAPPWNVIAGNIEFGNVRLPPAQAAAIPGDGIFRTG